MANTVASMIIRGRVIEDDLVEFGGRGGGLKFSAPDPAKYAGQIPIASPSGLADLYDLKLEDILDYLDELGTRLDNFEKAKAKQNAQDAISKYPDLGCMVGLFAYNPPLCLQAIREAGREVRADAN